MLDVDDVQSGHNASGDKYAWARLVRAHTASFTNNVQCGHVGATNVQVFVETSCQDRSGCVQCISV